MDAVWNWGPKVGGALWRTTEDVQDNYVSMSAIGFSQAGLSKYAAPGQWNDPDMLEIGNGGMTPDEYRTQMSLWSMLAAPLLASNDLKEMDTTTKRILMNKEVIAVDQDQLGIQGDRVRPPQTGKGLQARRQRQAPQSRLRRLTCSRCAESDMRRPVERPYSLPANPDGPIH